MQDYGYGLLRVNLSGTWVDKGVLRPPDIAIPDLWLRYGAGVAR